MSIKDIPQDLIETVSSLIGEIREFDESPPNETIKEWIKENRKVFEDRYGLDEGTRILYAKAWNMFKESTAAQHKALADDCLEPFCEEPEDDELLKLKAKVDAQSGLPELGESEEEKIEEDDIPGQDDSAFHKESEEKVLLADEDPEELKEGRYEAAIKLVEGFIDTDNLEHEAAIIALSNYPEEYKRKDVDGILRKVKVDLLKQGTQEISEELSDILKDLKVELQKHFRTSIKENYASPEPASAVGHRNGEEQPKHADLIHDVSIIGGERTDSYRLLVQYSSGRTEFIPSTDELGAPTPSALLDLVLDIPDDNNVLVYAIEDSLEVPSDSEQFSGNDKSE